ncbi:MAG: DUF3575 domain-containing protein [Muribaculaceae bacterium]|nr:DUF3575 domain-containing protein [Muribaculaceae bacterium]
MKILQKLLLALALLIGFVDAQAQFALKTNLLYDATTTPNLGAEVAVGSRSTLNLVYGLNPWKFDKDGDEKYAKHWVLMPEYRWWTCSVYNGHFLGVHAMTGQFNASNISLPIPGGFFGGDNLTEEVKDHRYEGWFAGIGVTYGYQWSLSRHWNLEAEIGLGYNHVWYDKFNCGTCGGRDKSGHTNYAGITKLGLSIMYIF